MTNNSPFIHLDGITPNELATLNEVTANMTEEQVRTFGQIYNSRRKKSSEILLFTLLGFVVIAGVQRFVLGQIAMGLLYLFTGGFCLIGTIIDVINNKSLTDEYNRKMAYECLALMR